MNNFEKRKFLDYVDKLLPMTNVDNYSFGDVFDFMVGEFKMDKKVFPLDEDGDPLLETTRQRDNFSKVLKKEVKKLKEKIKPKNTSLEKQFNIVRDIYDLNSDEYEILICLTLREVNNIIKMYIDCLEGNSITTFCRGYLSMRCGKKERTMYGLYLKNISESRHNDSLNDYLLKIFDNPKCNTLEQIASTIIGKSEKATLKPEDYKHLEKELNIVVNILQKAVEKKKKGINILLYGGVGTGKSEFSRLAADAAKIPMYSVITQLDNFKEADRENRLVDLYSKQHVLSHANKACILFDEGEDVMNRGFGSFGSASKGYLNTLLETTAVPIIWTTNNIYDVDPAFLRRMTYCIEFEKLSESVRLNIWKKTLRRNNLKIPKAKLEELNSSYDIPPSLIANAVKTTKMIGGNADDFEGLIENVAKVVVKKKVVKEQKDTTTEGYNIDLVNADIDLKDLTNKIKNSGKLNFSLCLYGAPGSSKSSFARYLASELGLEVVQKRASDLLDMYVGNSEKNIAAAFAECRAKKCMLIIDEADSLLQDRNNAHASWEISQINEMLTQMESFEYPFVATTNIMDSLDEACLRRFTFKVRHSFMTPEQVELAVRYFFKDIKHDGKVTDIKGLTAGDFVTVKRKADFLCVDNLDEIRRMLTEEVKLKKCSDLKNTIGFTL